MLENRQGDNVWVLNKCPQIDEDGKEILFEDILAANWQGPCSTATIDTCKVPLNCLCLQNLYNTCMMNVLAIARGIEECNHSPPGASVGGDHGRLPVPGLCSLHLQWTQGQLQDWVPAEHNAEGRNSQHGVS